MKIWKVLAAVAAVATLVPYKVEKDEENGETRVQALLWSAKHRINAESGEDALTVNIGPTLPAKAKADEDEAGLYDDSVILVETPLAPETPAEEVPVEETPAPETNPA